MSIKVENINKILESIENLANTASVEEAIGRACAIVEADAKKKAPKGSGDLRRSITSKVEGLEGVVYTPLLYAPYVEYGTGLFAEGGGRTDVPWVYRDDEGHWHSTSGMKPHPYMRPALNENREKIITMIKESLTND